MEVLKELRMIRNSNQFLRSKFRTLRIQLSNEKFKQNAKQSNKSSMLWLSSSQLSVKVTFLIHRRRRFDGRNLKTMEIRIQSSDWRILEFLTRIICINKSQSSKLFSQVRKFRHFSKTFSVRESYETGFELPT